MCFVSGQRKWGGMDLDWREKVGGKSAKSSSSELFSESRSEMSAVVGSGRVDGIAIVGCTAPPMLYGCLLELGVLTTYEIGGRQPT